MIYELRIYTLRPGTQAEYVRLQAEVGRPIRGDRFGTLVGAWATEFGTLNQYFHMWSHPDPVERERLRAGLQSDERWAREFLAQSRHMLLAQENMILYPVDGVPFTAPSAASTSTSCAATAPTPASCRSGSGCSRGSCPPAASTPHRSASGRPTSARSTGPSTSGPTTT